jgi:hypothetical protein
MPASVSFREDGEVTDGDFVALRLWRELDLGERHRPPVWIRLLKVEETE